MQKVVKRDFTTAFMVLELTWGSLDRKQQSLFIKGTPQQWLPCWNPYLSSATIRPRGRLKVEQIVKRYLAHRLKQLWVTIRTNPHPEKNKKLEISVARLRLLSCFVGFSGSWSWSSLGDLIKPVAYGGRMNEMTRFALFMMYCRLVLTWQQSC